MKVTYYLICVVLILSCKSMLVAQVSSEIDHGLKILPPSPTASSLGQYGEIPISLYSGTPNINIPLLALKGRELSVPISLSYHASGIKVDQISSWVGLGWSLSSGGVITRSIRGVADELPNGFRGYNQIGSKVYDYINGQLPPEEQFDLKDNIAKGLWDGEPDTYYFNFLGNSGKIVFDHTGQPLIIPYQNLKIEGNGSPTIGYTITDMNGTKFIFKDIELSSSLSTCESDPPETDNVTAWYLTKIISSKSEEINFFYADEFLSYTLANSESDQFLLSKDGFGQCSSNTQTCLAETNVTGKRLMEIRSENQTIKFVQSPDTYVQGGYLLDNIQLFTNDELLIPRKTFEFNYELGERVILKSVKEKSKSSEYKPPHIFDYYIPSGNISNRLSVNQDHWGYFNANSSGTLIPPLIFNENGSNITLSGGDREPNIDKIKTLLLSKITYPTGGTSTFEFEPHDYGYIGANEYDKPSYVLENLSVLAQDQSIVQSDTIFIYEDQVLTLTGIPTTPPWMVNENGEPIGDISLVGLDEAISYSIVFEVPATNKTIPIGLKPGKYLLTVESYEVDGAVQANMLYDKKVGISKSTVGGGVRIKRITNDSGAANTPVNIKEFVYSMMTDTARSSGVLLSKPKYDYVTHAWIPDEPMGGDPGIPETDCKFLNRTSNSQAVLGSTQGSTVGYREVTELIGANGIGGKTWTHFSSPVEYPDYGTIYSFPFPPSTSYDHRRGKVLASKTYKYTTGGSFALIEEIQNTYTIDVSNNKKLLEALKVGYLEQDLIENDVNVVFEEANYDYHQEWIYLKETTKQTYNDLNILEIKTSYFHDNPDHLLLTRTESVNSKGQIISNKVKYPQDYLPNVNPIIDTMISRRILAESIEKIQYVNSNVVDVRAKEFNLYQGLVLQDKSYVLEPDTLISNYVESSDGKAFPNLDEELIYDYWDDKGNLLEYHKANDIHTLFIWGYNQTLPIAKIVNSTYSQIENVLSIGFTLDGENGNNLSASQIGLLRNSPVLSNAQIFTYTYDVIDGLKSSTDPSGKTTTYEYDDFGRLYMTKDDQGNIIKTYKYNYRELE